MTETEYSMPGKRPGYTAVSLPIAVRDHYQRATLRLSAELTRRLSMGAVAEAALTIAERHPEEMRAALAPEQEGTPDE